MNKIYVLALISIGLGSTTLCVSKTDLEKFEKAIGSSNFHKVLSLVYAYEKKSLPAQERKAFMGQLARIASDVVTDRKERLSLKGNLHDILTYTDREKARDISLVAIGAALAALGCWQGKHTYASYQNGGVRDRSRYFKELVFNGGIATLGVSFGTYLAYQGYTCVMQNSALKTAQEIESFLSELAGNKAKTVSVD